MGSLAAQFKNVKKGLANTGNAAVLRASKDSTREELKARHSQFLNEKESILKQSWNLFFKVCSTGGMSGMGNNAGMGSNSAMGSMDGMGNSGTMGSMDGNGGMGAMGNNGAMGAMGNNGAMGNMDGNGGMGAMGSNMVLNRQMVEDMVAAGATLALQQHQQRLQQQQQQQQLQNGGVGDTLRDMHNDVKKLARIKEAAVESVLADPDEYDMILDRAAEKLVQRKPEAVFKAAVENMLKSDPDDIIMEAAARIKRARIMRERTINGEEDEEEEEEEKTSSDEEQSSEEEEEEE